MKVKVINTEKEFPRIMKCIKFPDSDCISMISYQENKYFETILKGPNPLNIGYHREVDLADWEDFSGEIILSN